MEKVYLIGCTKRKQKYRCYAEEMYKSSVLFCASFNYALRNVKDKNSQIFILSAKHHLLKLDQIIEPYDKTLNEMKKSEKEEWGNIVYEQMKKQFDIQDTHFIFLAGRNYIEPLEKYLNSNQYTNPIPPEERTIGRRIKWLKKSNVK